MNYAMIIKNLQQSILSAQMVLDELQCLEEECKVDIYITRQEAADLLGKGLRQLDRDCAKYGIRRRNYNNGIRISKRDILVHIGAISDGNEKESDNDFNRILRKGGLK